MFKHVTLRHETESLSILGAERLTVCFTGKLRTVNSHIT